MANFRNMFGTIVMEVDSFILDLYRDAHTKASTPEEKTFLVTLAGQLEEARDRARKNLR